MNHYDLEALFRYVDGTSPIAEEIESHVASCETCSAEVGEQRQMVIALSGKEVWERGSTAAPAPATRQFIIDVVAFADQAKHEAARAAQLCDEILSGPAAWWQQRLRTTPDAFTAGMVKELLDRMRQTLEVSPTNALHITTLATEIASALDVTAYPSDYVIRLRGQAFRDHAYVLSFIGRYPEALQFTEHAERLLAQVPLPQYDLARLAVVKATVLRRIERIDEAIVLARSAAATFLRFGDRARHVNTRMTEAAFVFESGAVEAALGIWKSLEDDPGLDALGRIRLTHNIGLCHAELQQPVLAIEYLQRCIPEFEMLGLATERTRSRWALSQAFVSAGRPNDAVALLRQTRFEFDELDMIVDGALAALELAEALLMVGEPDEVPTICRELIARFTAAGMASRAITALAFLREAVAIGQASPSLIRHVHAFLRQLPAEQARIFASPPPGRGGE